MWHILHASFWKFSELSNGGISSNWSIIDEKNETTGRKVYGHAINTLTNTERRRREALSTQWCYLSTWTTGPS